MLNMTQQELADMAVVGRSTVIDFELGRRKVSEEIVADMQDALEEEGAVFTGGDGVRYGRGRPSDPAG
jgi:transcriptional regulator with XRE-family HTH domain